MKKYFFFDPPYSCRRFFAFGLLSLAWSGLRATPLWAGASWRMAEDSLPQKPHLGVTIPVPLGHLPFYPEALRRCESGLTGTFAPQRQQRGLSAWVTKPGEAVGEPDLESETLDSQQPRHLLDRLEASVNGDPILRSDFTKFRETLKLRTQLDPLFAGSSLAARAPEQLKDSEIREFLIDELLMTQQFPKSDAETEQAIHMIQSNNRLDRDTLLQALAREGYEFADYFELIRRSSSKNDLFDRDIRPKVGLPDDNDLKNYFNAHYARKNKIPRVYRLRMMVFPFAQFASAAATQQAASEAYKRLKAGESFSEIDPHLGSQPAGATKEEQEGDLGLLPEDQIAPEVQEQIKTLQIGQFSPVFGGLAQERLAIVQLVDIQSGMKEQYEHLKEEMRNQLSTIEFQHQVQLWVERQRQKAFIHRAGETTLTEAAAILAPQNP